MNSRQSMSVFHSTFSSFSGSSLGLNGMDPSILFCNSLSRHGSRRVMLPLVEIDLANVAFRNPLALIDCQFFHPLLFIRGFIVQQGQVTLPAYSHNPCEQGPILRRNICKVESGDCGPKL